MARNGSKLFAAAIFIAVREAQGLWMNAGFMEFQHTEAPVSCSKAKLGRVQRERRAQSTLFTRDVCTEIQLPIPRMLT